MKNDNVKINEEDYVITLFSDDGTPIEFYELASVEYNGKFYELVQPVELNDEIAEDEAVVFEFTAADEGEGTYTPVFDETLLAEIFEEYMRAVADLDGECGGSGCGGECNCGGDCDCEDGDSEESCGEECSKNGCSCKK